MTADIPPRPGMPEESELVFDGKLLPKLLHIRPQSIEHNAPVGSFCLSLSGARAKPAKDNAEALSDRHIAGVYLGGSTGQWAFAQ
jgi:hypothetical protein